MSNQFEEWFKDTEQNNSYKSVAREAWNAAIDHAADMVRKEFDECEPWITPEEIVELIAE